MNWISVDDCLPPYGMRVMLTIEYYEGEAYVATGWRAATDIDGEHWRLTGKNKTIQRITAWAVQPEPMRVSAQPELDSGEK